MENLVAVFGFLALMFAYWRRGREQSALLRRYEDLKLGAELRYNDMLHREVSDRQALSWCHEELDSLREVLAEKQTELDVTAAELRVCRVQLEELRAVRDEA